MRAPVLTIRYKILALMVFLVALAIASYFTLATRLFSSDKTAYIYETNALLVESYAADVETTLNAAIKSLNQIAETAGDDPQQVGSREGAIASIFQGDSDLVELSLFFADSSGKPGSKTPKLQLHKADYFSPYEADKKYVETLRLKDPVPWDRVRAKGVAIGAPVASRQVPLLFVYLRKDAGGPGGFPLVVAASLRPDRFVKIFSKSEMYSAYLLDSGGNALLRPSSGDPFQDTSLPDLPFVREIMGGAFSSGAREFSTNDHVFLGSFAKLALGDLVIFSCIDKEIAFLAAKRLMEKTILLAVLVVLVSIILSILFSRRLTAALHKLHQATQKISRGEFDIQVEVGSRDEIGALSSAFNQMATEIQRLLTETRDKAVIEKEIETAKTVQENLFPAAGFTARGVALTGYYTPASACGGDWWGFLPLGSKLVVLIGDATGHGVPAALVTAAAQSCCTTFVRLNTHLSGALLSPRRIMETLNTAIYYAAKGTIKMTFFVSIIDLESGELRYCNASHEMPLVSRGWSPEAPRDKSGLSALGGAPDPALGDSPDTQFHEHSFQLQPGDALTWYTDGLTEGRNTEKEEFGESRFSRAFVKCAHLSADEIKAQILEKARGFYGAAPLEDDVTLVVAKVGDNVHFGKGKPQTGDGDDVLPVGIPEPVGGGPGETLPPLPV